MDTVFQFTPAQVVGAILGVAAAIVALSKAWDVITGTAKKVNAPQEAQDRRLDEAEKRLNDHDASFRRYDEYFRRDNERIKAIEEGNRVVQKALLALLAHAIDGNNTAQLQEATKDLQQYLINR